MEIYQKVQRIERNLMELICAQEENDFAILDGGQQCIASSLVEIKTCANKAIYLVAKRLLEKWIENEHFELKMVAEDCKYAASETKYFSTFY